MTVIYSAAAKTARMNAIVTQIGASGKLKLLSSTDQILATFPLAATAGTVSGSVLTLSDANGATAGIMNTTATLAGTATKATLTTSGDVVVVTLGVGLNGSGADFEMDNSTVTVGQAVTVNTATLTHAA